MSEDRMEVQHASSEDEGVTWEGTNGSFEPISIKRPFIAYKDPGGLKIPFGTLEERVATIMYNIDDHLYREK